MRRAAPVHVGRAQSIHRAAACMHACTWKWRFVRHTATPRRVLSTRRACPRGRAPLPALVAVVCSCQERPALHSHTGNLGVAAKQVALHGRPRGAIARCVREPGRRPHLRLAGPGTTCGSMYMAGRVRAAACVRGAAVESPTSTWTPAQRVILVCCATNDSSGLERVRLAAPSARAGVSRRSIPCPCVRAPRWRMC